MTKHVKHIRAFKYIDWTFIKVLILISCIPGTVMGLNEEWDIVSIISAVLAVAVLIIPSIRKVDEWQRAIVLRLGKFQTVRGPGIFLLIPIVERIAQIIDIRIQISDFSAQDTLTKDSVSLNANGFAFWLVWDPQKAALEVENYQEAVALATKAALRNAISSNDLSRFLENSGQIEQQIQAEVERQTTEWGITVQYVEITDLKIPHILKESLARLAKAEREKKARILLAEAEIDVAKKLEIAADIYAKNAPALKLKALSILSEGLKDGNSMILVPHEITEELKIDSLFGLEALTRLQKKGNP
ncbi:MAG: hypothetical protein LBQ77_02575 [Treponema sp.]|jgi:regulator of protease activity HflC (stomatin/prohibitin superfamily)|nr:hypothetical protein [Treponema sp.]